MAGQSASPPRPSTPRADALSKATGALTMSNNWHLAHTGAEMFSNCISSFIPFGECAQCGAKIQPRPQAIIDKLGARSPERFLLCPQCKRQSIVRNVAQVRSIRRQENP